jgi:glutamine amidotransferase/cyclase
MKVYILDYGAGNVRSIVNALTKLGHKVNWITSPADFLLADKLIFPGVGNFGNGMAQLHAKGLAEPLKAYLQANRPFLGICVGMQCLFTASDEAEQSQGLGIIDARVERFNLGKPVPHIGWNSCKVISPFVSESRFYFVHSYAVKLAGLSPQAIKWVSALTNYGGEVFVSAIQRGNIFATQFHPEKSGKAGLELIESFLAAKNMELDGDNTTLPRNVDINVEDDLAKRIIACLDVRSNDQGDLVVTKGFIFNI